MKTEAVKVVHFILSFGNNFLLRNRQVLHCSFIRYSFAHLNSFLAQHWMKFELFF